MSRSVQTISTNDIFYIIITKGLCKEIPMYKEFLACSSQGNLPYD